MNKVANLYFPLSPKDVELIKNGETVKNHYHFPTLNIKTLFVLVSKVKHERKEFKHLFKVGISVTSIVFGEKSIQQIVNNDCVIAEYGLFRIIFLSEKHIADLKRKGMHFV